MRPSGSQGGLHSPYKAVQSIERFSNSGSREWISLEKESRSSIQANTITHFNFYWTSWSRIFDKDGDGYVSKKEFKWMTANKRISQRKVDIMFEVRSVGGPAFIWCLEMYIVYCRGATWIRMGGWTTRNLKCWFSATEREKNLPGVKIKPCRDGKVARCQNSRNKIYYQLDVLFILETLKYIGCTRYILFK